MNGSVVESADNMIPPFTFSRTEECESVACVPVLLAAAGKSIRSAATCLLCGKPDFGTLCWECRKVNILVKYGDIIVALVDAMGSQKDVDYCRDCGFWYYTKDMHTACVEDENDHSLLCGACYVQCKTEHPQCNDATQEGYCCARFRKSRTVWRCSQLTKDEFDALLCKLPLALRTCQQCGANQPPHALFFFHPGAPPKGILCGWCALCGGKEPEQLWI